MSRSKSIGAILVFGLSGLFALPGALLAQDVVRHPDGEVPLAQRWAWAATEAGGACSQECWIAYSFQRMMETNSYTGWNSTHSNHPTFQSLVYGREVEPVPDRGHGDRIPDESRTVLKEVAILFRYEQSGRSIGDVRVSNISLPVELGESPLVWLGRSDQFESVQLLYDLYARAEGVEIKEDLVSAIGMHSDADLVVPILREVLSSDAPDDVREQAVFWLAETRDADILPLLERTARGDVSEEVREQAVFGVSRIETDAADELLISLARNLEDSEIREEAIFWLGQKASKKAGANLEDIAENDPNLEIQKKAVFALSQLPADEGIPRLISIAQTHRNAEIRHDAIFWLGESGDPRAVDLLVELVRGR